MKTLTILLVEDEESLASFIQTELTFEGYQVIWAPDGQKALDVFAEKPIDLILLDWMLPKYDGITVARRIRKESVVPIIMMTARTQTSDIVQGLDTGLDDYITKPFAIEELFARIRVIERRLADQGDEVLLSRHNTRNCQTSSQSGRRRNSAHAQGVWRLL